MNGDSFQCVITNSQGAVTTTPSVLVVNTPYALVTFAGLPGTSGSTDGTGTAARFNSPSDLALDSSGNVFVADTVNQVIRKITSAGVVTTLAGQTGVAGSADGSGTAAQFRHPSGIAVDSAGVLYVADTDNDTVRKVTSAGAVTTLAGLAGSAGSTDGTGSAARFSGPSGIVVDSSGNVYVADTLNDTIRKVSTAGAVSTIAGAAGSTGFSDATGSAARFWGPQGLALDASGTLFVADSVNSAIRKDVLASGVVTTVAGGEVVLPTLLIRASTVVGSAPPTVVLLGSGTTDGPGSQAKFTYPCGVAVDGSGNLYVADTDNHTLRGITPNDAVSTLAGSAGSSGTTDGIGTAARLNFPTGVAVSSTGDVYIADASNHAIRLAVVPAAPAFTTQPQNQTVTAGGSASFSVAASGKPSPTYQWYLGGTAISGATSASLAISNAQSANAGNYTVTATNLVGSATSSSASLTVNPANTGGGSSSGGSTGGGGGGGAPSFWFYGAGCLLLLARRFGHRK